MKRFLLSVMLMFGLVATPMVVAAQPAATDTSFQSALTGDVIDLGTSGEIVFVPESYDLSEGQTVSEEYIWFAYGWSNFELVIVEGDIEVAEYYDLTVGNMVEFYDVFEIAQEEVGVDYAWFVATAEYQGNTMLVYYDYQLDALGEFDLLVMQFSPIDALAMDMGFVQQEVTIGDLPLLAEANGEELEAIVTGETPAGNTTGSTTRTGTDTGRAERPGRIADSGTGENATAEATEATGTTRGTRATRSGQETATEEATETAGTTRGTRSTRSSQETATEEATETAGTTRGTRTTRSTSSNQTTATEAAGGEWESMGLVSDTEWVSPQFQTDVTWDGGLWVFPADYDRAITVSEDPLYDVIVLETVDGQGFVFLSIEEAGTENPESYADYWESPEFAATFEQEISIVEISTTADTATVIYETVTNSGDPLFMVYTVTFMEDGTVVATRIASDSAGIADVYGQFVEGVQVNGAPLTMNYTAEEIAVLVGD